LIVFVYQNGLKAIFGILIWIKAAWRHAVKIVTGEKYGSEKAEVFLHGS